MKLSDLWVYKNRAVSDREGKAFFTKQNKDFNAGYEGGSISRSGANDRSVCLPCLPCPTVRNTAAII